MRYIDADALKTDILMKYKGNWEVPCLPEDRIIQRVVTDVRVLIERSITADVAPKSEVERLEAELDDLKRDTIPKLQYGLQRANTMGRDLEVELEAMRTAANSYKMHYESLAREIFEEIEELAKIYTFPVVKNGVVEIAKEPFWCIEPNDLAELKKKYTEDSDES